MCALARMRVRCESLVLVANINPLIGVADGLTTVNELAALHLCVDMHVRMRAGMHIDIRGDMRVKVCLDICVKELWGRV